MTHRARIVRTIAISSLLATSIWTLSSCSSKQEASEQSTTNTAPSDTGIGSMPSTPSAPAVSDANIAAIVVAANQADIDNEVAVHQTVLDALDTQLIPNAQNPQLKQLLTETRPVIAQHLDHAKLIQTKLGGTAMQ